LELQRSELTENLTSMEQTLSSVRQQLNDAQTEVHLPSTYSLFVFNYIMYMRNLIKV